MKIYIKTYYGRNFYLIMELDADRNYEEGDKIEHLEDLTETLYEKDVNGKNIYSKSLGLDITDKAMDTYTNILSEIIYHRKKPFDSTELIMALFEKLTDDQKMKTVDKIYDELPGDGCDELYKRLHRDNTLSNILNCNENR